MRWSSRQAGRQILVIEEHVAFTGLSHPLGDIFVQESGYILPVVVGIEAGSCNHADAAFFLFGSQSVDFTQKQRPGWCEEQR